MHPSLWRATGIRGVLAIVGRDGRSPVFGAPPPAPPVEDPGGALARRYLQVHGPVDAAAVPLLGRCSRCRTRSGCGRARASSPRSSDGVGARRGRGRSTRRRREGARLLPNLDPLASAKDREVLVPDEAVRKRIWSSLGGPGMALVDGEVAGLWRPRKKGKRLVVELEPLRTLTKAEREALAAEAERLAPFRGRRDGRAGRLQR